MSSFFHISRLLILMCASSFYKSAFGPIKIIIPLALVFLFTMTLAYASNDTSILSVKGFGTLAGTGTDTNAIGFRRDITAETGATKSWRIPTDSRLGLQLDAQFNEQLSASVQWVLKEKQGDFFEQNLDMAFLRWSPSPEWTLRFGRVPSDIFMLADHRNISYAYPWMRPPQEFYGFNPVYHYDGIDITKKFRLSEGLLSLKVSGGYSFTQAGPIDNGAGFFSSNVIYEFGNWKSRLSYSQGHTSKFSFPNGDELINAISSPQLNAIWPNIQSFAPQLSMVGTTIHYSALGIAYDDGLWLGQAEAAYINSGNHPLLPNLANGYISIGRRVAKLTVYTLLGISKSFGDHYDIPQPLFPDPRLLAAQQEINNAINNGGIDEKSVSLGLRWDFYTNMAFKVQWSHYWLGQNGTQSWLEDPTQSPPDEVNVFSTGIDFVF